MPDFLLQDRPALAGIPTGRYGNEKAGIPGITLTALAQGFVLQVLAAPAATGLAGAMAGIGGNGAHAVRTAGPGQWFVVGDTPLGGDQFALFAQGLAGRAALIDQSHGRARIRIAGPFVEQALAKGTAVDLHPVSFPVGHAATTLTGHVSVHMTRLGPDVFELMVLRSFAVSLWESFVEMGLEFGVECIDRTSG